jgi:hypothetical protein
MQRACQGQCTQHNGQLFAHSIIYVFCIVECPDITARESRAELHYHVLAQGQGLLWETKICLGVKFCQNAKQKEEEKRIIYHDRVIRIVRQTQHQNPEFRHTQGNIKKKPAKKYISIQRSGG